jgi:tetratricopeptide (TPR) repeat protein
MTRIKSQRLQFELIRFICVHLSLILVFLTFSSLSIAQQSSSAEDLSFSAVSAATNAAARLAAAEDFVANFPQSTKRPRVAKLVAEHLTTLRNPEVAIALVKRARSMFTSPAELEFINPAALEVYVKGNRVDEAFELAAELLSGKPNEIRALSKMTYLGAQEALNRKLIHAEASVKYGLQAADIIEKEQRPTDMSDSDWAVLKLTLPGLYQQIGLINIAQGKTNEAKIQIVKATELGPKDPSSFALLGRMLNAEYEKLMAAYQAISDGNSKREERRKLDTLLDRIIDAYARAAGLATGKVKYQSLLQQTIPDLVSYYKYRHNQSTVGLQELIDKYR